MGHEKILYIWERVYPHAIALCSAIFLKRISFDPLVSKEIGALAEGIVTLDSIIIGFMGAVIPVILSMKNESKLVRYVFDRDKDGLFKKYISETIAYGLLDVCISLTVYLRDLVMNKYVLNVMGFLFIYCFILFITSTYRGMSCMLKLIFSDDHKIEKNVSNVLSDKEKEDLWSRKGQ